MNLIQPSKPASELLVKRHLHPCLIASRPHSHLPFSCDVSLLTHRFYAAGLSGSKGLPFLVMAAWSCAATGLIIWLPETAGTHVPDTLSDLDRLARSGGAAQHLRAVLRRWREGRRPLLAESRQQQQAGAGVREGGVVPS
jgi:hypothetical protein